MKIKLEVNGQEISLNRFASAILSSTLLGLIQPLKGAENPRQVKIELTVDESDSTSQN